MKIKERRPGVVRQLALSASAEEVRKFEVIKAHHRRRSDSDTIRFLIEQEAEKILSQNRPIGLNNAQEVHG